MVISHRPPVYPFAGGFLLTYDILSIIKYSSRWSVKSSSGVALHCYGKCCMTNNVFGGNIGLVSREISVILITRYNLSER